MKEIAGAFPNGASSSAISELHATIFLNGPTKSVAAQTAILDALASETETTPTHGNATGDERKRLVFSAEAIAADAGTKVGSPILWRLKPPKYWSMLDASNQPIARLLFHYEDIDGQHIGPVFGAVTRLADKLEPAFAALHFRWSKPTAEHIASMQGIFAKALEYGRFGIPGVFAWTCFGPNLVKQLGAANLQALGATITSWGGASLSLAQQPWTIPFEQFRARQIEVDNALRPSGLFCDRSSVVPRKSARWVPLMGPEAKKGS